MKQLGDPALLLGVDGGPAQVSLVPALDELRARLPGALDAADDCVCAAGGTKHAEPVRHLPGGSGSTQDALVKMGDVVLRSDGEVAPVVGIAHSHGLGEG